MYTYVWSGLCVYILLCVSVSVCIYVRMMFTIHISFKIKQIKFTNYKCSIQTPNSSPIYIQLNDWFLEVKKFKFDHTNKWYIHNLESVLENETC